MTILPSVDILGTLFLWIWIISVIWGMIGSLAPLWAILATILTKMILDYLADQSYRSNYRHFIKDEITRAIDLLGREENKSGTGNLLPTDTWASMVNSGLLKLFSFDEVNKLSDAYFKIQAYNYEASRTRDIAEKYRCSVTSRERRHMHRYWLNASIRLDSKIRLDLLKALKNLEDASWLR
jgi:hypothetical protein